MTNTLIAKQISYRLIQGHRFTLSLAFIRLAIKILFKPNALYRLPIDNYARVDIPASNLFDFVTVLRYATWHLITDVTIVYDSKIIHPSEWVNVTEKAREQYNSLVQLNNGN